MAAQRGEETVIYSLVILYAQLYLPAVVKCFVLSLYRDTVLQAIFMLPLVHSCGGDSKAEVVVV